MIPEGVPTLAFEALATTGWEKFSHSQLGIDQFGVSAPYKDAYKHFGLTAENVCSRGLKLIEYFNKVGSVHQLPVHMPEM